MDSDDIRYCIYNALLREVESPVRWDGLTVRQQGSVIILGHDDAYIEATEWEITVRRVRI